jgi:hypothetical protein
MGRTGRSPRSAGASCPNVEARLGSGGSMMHAKAVSAGTRNDAVAAVTRVVAQADAGRQRQAGFASSARFSALVRNHVFLQHVGTELHAAVVTQAAFCNI